MKGSFLRGGMLADRRTYVLSVSGLLSAVAAYLVGDADVFATLQAIITIGGIYFMRKQNNQGGKQNGKNSGKISE